MRKYLKLLFVFVFSMPFWVFGSANAVGISQFRSPVTLAEPANVQKPLIKVRRVRIPVYIPGGGSATSSPWLAYLFGGMIVVGGISQVRKLMRGKGGNATKADRRKVNVPVENDRRLSEEDIDAMIANYKASPGLATQAAEPVHHAARHHTSAPKASRPDFGQRSQPMFGKRGA